MNNYELILILNPDLSTKFDDFQTKFEKTLTDLKFQIDKLENIGRRQLAYSILNHNKGHYILFNLEGDPSKLLEIETKIKYNESIIRHLFLVVKEHNGEDSSLFVESKNKKPEPSEVEKDKEDVKKDPEPVKEDVEDKSEAKQEEGEDNE